MSRTRQNEIGSTGTLTPDIEELFPIYRIWKETGTSLNEIKEQWTYEDVLNANAILDMYQSLEKATSAFDFIEMEKQKTKK